MKHSKTASLFRSLALIAGILIGGITAQAGTINENHNYLLHLLEYYNPTSFYIGDDTQQLFIGGSVIVKPFYNFRPTSGATGSSNPSDTPNYFFAPNAFDSDGNDGVYIPVDAVLSMVFHSDTPVGILDFALLVEYYSQGPDFDVNFDGLDAAFMRLQTHDSGVWIIGQTQSAFSNPAAWPETVEEEGPPAELFSWVPQVRWEATTGTTRWAVSVEAGDTDLNGCDAGCSVDNDIPDLVGTVAFYPKWGKAEFGAVLRTLKIHDTTNGSDTATGYGAAFSGYGNIPNGDMISYRLVGGVGLGHYMQDVVDMAGTVEADGTCPIPTTCHTIYPWHLP